MKNFNQILAKPFVHIIAQSKEVTTFILEFKHREYFVIASIHEEWDHVSVSCRQRKIMPSWDVISAVKDLCFDEEEVVMQLHPKKLEYVNLATNCLHLWKPQHEQIMTPPMYLVI